MEAPGPVVRIPRAIRLGSGLHIFRSTGCISKANNRRALGSVGSEGDVANKGGDLTSTLPTEVWLLILAWSGLKSSAVASACCAAFRDAHRTITTTPPLLARALLAEYGPARATAHLYGGPSGEPHPQHYVHSDEGVAAALLELLDLTAHTTTTTHRLVMPHVADGAPRCIYSCTCAMPCFSAAAAITSSCACSVFGHLSQQHRSMKQTLHYQLFTAVRGEAPASWPTGLSPVVAPHASALLRAAASAGHVRVAAAAMQLGARFLDGALVAASGCGRDAVVRLLLANGAEPDASEPFGPCALFQAAHYGHTEVVEVLLDAGAKIDGTAELPPGYEATVMALQSGPTGGASLAPAVDPTTPGFPQLFRPTAAGAPGVLSHSRHSPRRGPDPAYRAISSISKKQRLHIDPTELGQQVVQELEEPGTPNRTLDAASEPNVPMPGAGPPCKDGDTGRVDIGPRGPPPLRRRPRAMPLLRPLPRLPQLPPVATPLPPLPALSTPVLLLWPSQRCKATPLLAACQGGHAGTAAVLLRRGARLDIAHGSELIMAGHPDVVGALLASAPALSAHLNAALVSAAGANKADVVSALLSCGADPACSRGMALTEAAYQGHVAVVEVLVKAGGSRLRSCGALAMALQLAQRWGQSEVANLLLAATAA